MRVRDGGDVTQLLVMAREGDREAMDRLLPLVYTELRRVAERQLRGERREHTLGASGLIHEAYLKLVDQMQVDWQSREHFFAVSARAMRQVLIDYARKKNAENAAVIGIAPRSTARVFPPTNASRSCWRSIKLSIVCGALTTACGLSSSIVSFAA